MTLDRLHSSVIGLPLTIPINRVVNGNCASFRRGRWQPRAHRFLFFDQNQKGKKSVGFLQFGRGYVKFPLCKLSSEEDPFRVSCTNGSSQRNMSPVWFLSLRWKHLVFFTVLSAFFMAIWYGHRCARKFIEAHVIPSVCSDWSRSLQREIGFGKVHGLSLLGFTLQSCSIGPSQEEFSCGQFPRLRLRLKPFASLRRGKIVMDAVLLRPNILIAQKEDFSWLTIPSPSEGELKRHSSSEEGIDYRTKTRRLAREKASLNWYEERVDAARKAAEMGYVVPEEYSSTPFIGDSAADSFSSPVSVDARVFSNMDDGKLWLDHHSADMGMEYVLKHVELEKSFGTNVPTAGFKLWRKFVAKSWKGKSRRESHRKTLDEDTITYKRRNLECSARAAHAYFGGRSNGDVSDISTWGSLLNAASAASGNKNEIAYLDVGEHGDIDRVSNSINVSYGNYVAKQNPGIGDDTENRWKLENLESSYNPENGDNNHLESHKKVNTTKESFGDKHANEPSSSSELLLTIKHEINRLMVPIQLSWVSHVFGKGKLSETGNRDSFDVKMERHQQIPIIERHECLETISNNLGDIIGASGNGSEGNASKYYENILEGNANGDKAHDSLHQPSKAKLEPRLLSNLSLVMTNYMGCLIYKMKSYINTKAECLASEFIKGVDFSHIGGTKNVPVTIDTVYFTEGTLMLLAYGDREPREMDNVNGHVEFQNHYSRVHVQLSGNCREWRSDGAVKDGGQLSADIFIDIVDQKWHANLKLRNLFAPLFERILELPITWSKGSATGEVHICMSDGETFPNIYGQLNVRDLAFHILEAPSLFSDLTANLCFRGQRIFLHNASGRFGDVPLEASGDVGINPEDGEFHLMCQVPSVEVNSLMKTLQMKPLVFSLAGSVTAVFNCQGPLDAPIFVGSGIISRKTPYSASNLPLSPANEAVNRNREAGAVAAFDHIPFSHVSANFTFNTDNCVADLYGMRSTLLDGGEIRGAGNVWACPEGEEDDSAMDLNLSGSLIFDRVISRYLPTLPFARLKIGELNGEAKISGTLLKPRFDIKWGAPRAEDSFRDARGDIIISYDYITVNSSSVAFDLYMNVKKYYPQDPLKDTDYYDDSKMVPLVIEGLDVDLRLRGFDFSTMLLSNNFDAPEPVHLKATGRIKFLGKVVKPDVVLDGSKAESSRNNFNNQRSQTLVGEVSLSGVKVNQLTVAPQLTGSLMVSREKLKLDAAGRPDELMSIEVVEPLWSVKEDILQGRPSFSISLQKGQLKAAINYQPQNMANLEVRNLPLDELELASLRGMIQRAELQLNFQKRRGHGLLSVIHPKFSGVLGEALDVVARWRGDVITVEKSILDQAASRYELQGEYVLPGTRDRYTYKEREGLIKKTMDGNLGSMISSMGRWRLRLEVPYAEASEMLPLARLLSRSIDPSVHSRSKDFFLQRVQSMGYYAGSLWELLETIRAGKIWSDGVAMEEIALPGLAELRGRWRGSLYARGGGDGDTSAEFDFHGDDWEWGSYELQRILAVGAYSNNSGLHLDNMFIQKDNATFHANGTMLGPISNLHFAALNLPISLLPKLVQAIESSTTDSLGSLWQLLAPIKGILHMEGDYKGSFSKPECDVKVRLLDGAIGGIDLGRAEVVASIKPTSRFLFNAKFEPIIQSGHVHVRGNVPVLYIQDDSLEGDDNNDADRTIVASGWTKENVRTAEENDKKNVKDRSEDGWDTQLSESLKDLNWNILDDGEVKVDAEIKDGGMMLLTAMCPYANWLDGYADINLQIRGTVEQPIFDGSASFHRASVSSPLLQKPLSNFAGTILVKENRLCVISMESRVSRKGKLAIKGSLPLKTRDSSAGDKIDIKCEVLEVRAKNVFSGQVDSHIQIDGSILQPNISGKVKLSHGEAYLPHDKGNGDAINTLTARKPGFPATGYGQLATSGHASPFFRSQPASPPNRLSESSAKEAVEEAIGQVNIKPGLDIRLTDLKLFLGPELRIVYPLILNFAVSGGLELNGIAHPKLIRPKGVLTFENGDINLVATQVRLKRDHLNVAKFEQDVGLDPTLDLALVGSEWQFRIQSPASKWQDNLVITSTRSVDQDVLSPTEAAKVFESQLAESLLERDGQLAFKKLATATLESLMPKIEGKGEFGKARWRLVYAPQIPSLLSVDPTIDPFKSLANSISFGTEVEVQLGKRLQASVVRQMKDSEMAVQWTLVYQLTSRLRVLFQSSPATRLLFEYSATSQD